MKKMEIERKFLVNFPSSWIQLSELIDNLIDVKRISQTYLKSEEGEPSIRVRKTVSGLTGDADTYYHFNQKKPVKNSINEETEFSISKNKYEDNLKNSDPDRVPIDKTRFVFKFEAQVFELDIFKGPLKGLAILEIELNDEHDEVKLPPYLSIIEEVTDDKRFNNYNLASKKVHDILKFNM